MPLSEEDKNWIREQFLVQGRDLQGKFRDLQGQINDLRGKILELDGKINDSEARLLERIHDSETRLLTEFHKWASPNEARQRAHSASLQALDLELEALRDRVESLEKKAKS
jgi:peptidoglycan hydrolase CwlO-like protein